jgi:thioredoxin 1
MRRFTSQAIVIGFPIGRVAAAGGSCAYCAAMEPVLQQVAETLRSREQIFRVNVATEVDLASTYEIEGTPTLIMFSEGREVARSEGLDPDAATVLEALTAPFGLQ